MIFGILWTLEFSCLVFYSGNIKQREIEKERLQFEFRDCDDKLNGLVEGQSSEVDSNSISKRPKFCLQFNWRARNNSVSVMAKSQFSCPKKTNHRVPIFALSMITTDLHDNVMKTETFLWYGTVQYKVTVTHCCYSEFILNRTTRAPQVYHTDFHRDSI